MKIMSWMIIVVCCAFAWAPYTPADAQQRDRGRDRGDTTNITKNYYGQRGGGYGRGGGGGHRSYYRDRRPGYRYDSGRGWYDPSAVVGGAIGGWLWRQFAQPEPAPQVIVVPQQPVRDLAYCYQRYRSFDGSTYLGFDGYRHPCP